MAGICNPCLPLPIFHIFHIFPILPNLPILPILYRSPLHLPNLLCSRQFHQDGDQLSGVTQMFILQKLLRTHGMNSSHSKYQFLFYSYFILFLFVYCYFVKSYFVSFVCDLQSLCLRTTVQWSCLFVEPSLKITNNLLFLLQLNYYVTHINILVIPTKQ